MSCVCVSETIIPSSIITTSTVSSLNASVSSLPSKAHLFPTNSDKFATLSTEIQPSVLLPHITAATSSSQPSVLSKIPKSLKQSSKNRRKSEQKNRNRNPKLCVK
ncbi:hypothetical protein TNCV_1991341 [Trichonephila clavipes]|nr:hypothetical protein TNCV_1991341 [Trichonephila clavipes]